MNPLIAAVLFAATLLQQGPSPAPKTAPSLSVTSQENTGRQKQKANHADQTSQQSLPVPARRQPSATATNQNGGTPAPKNEDQSVRVTSIPKVSVQSAKDGWDIALVIATVLLVVVGAFQIRFLWSAVKTANANAIALVTSERAWVIAELIPMAAMYGKWWHRLEPYGPVSMSDEEVLAGHHLRHRLRLKNIGKTPAHILGFQISYSVLPDESPPSKEPEVHADTRVCDFWLVPNQEETVEPIVDIARHVNALIKEVGDAKKSVMLRIQGWVKYQHIFSGKDASETAGFEYLYSSATGSLNKARVRKAEQQRENPNHHTTFQLSREVDPAQAQRVGNDGD